MKLFVYDHCPYCVRARMPFGFKGIDLELVTLLNDDLDTPVSMIGEKMVPILEKDDGTWMPESLDIIAYIDGNFGGEPALAEAAEREDLAAWLSDANDVMRRLTMPRWVQAPIAEFATRGAIDYFTHAKEETIGPFGEQLEATDALKGELTRALQKLAPMIESPRAVSGTLSYDDIRLFGHLRGVTIFKGAEYPPSVRAYLETMAELSGVPLYDDIAIA